MPHHGFPGQSCRRVLDVTKARLRAELEFDKAETIRQKFIPNLTIGLIARSAPLAGTPFVQPRIRRADDLFPLGFLLVAASAEPLRWLFADVCAADAAGIIDPWLAIVVPALNDPQCDQRTFQCCLWQYAF